MTLQPLPEQPDGIYTGDALELSKQIPDHSIDLIFTDPPYLKEFLSLYEWLPILAERVLKPNGFIMVYSGIYHKDKIMQMMRDSLDYFWDFALHGSGYGPMIWNKRIISNYKSILAYTLRGSKARPRTNAVGCFTGTGQDKRYHVWGQDETSARYYIDCFSQVGDIVLDPFCGGGTTAAICKMLDRRCISFEIDPQTADIARARVVNQQMPLKNSETTHQNLLSYEQSDE